MLDKFRLSLMNDIIYNIYVTDDLDTMRVHFLNMLNLIVPYKASSFYLASEDKSHLLGNPVSVGFSHEELQLYLNKYEQIDYTRWLFTTGENIVYRESDFFDDARREKEVYFQDLKNGNRIYFSVQMGLAFHHRFLGVITLYRSREEEDFSGEELEILELIMKHLSLALHRHLPCPHAETLKEKDENNMGEYIMKYHLTLREAEIFTLLRKNKSNEDICETLCISPHTLKKHRSNIYHKLGVQNKLELCTMK
ncbi:MAG: LuxR C-terminal-related transcriptional regulator [Anaerovorax sp.]